MRYTGSSAREGETVMAPGLKTRLDYGDYTAIPADGRRWELLDGEPHVSPAPSPLAHRRDPHAP